MRLNALLRVVAPVAVAVGFGVTLFPSMLPRETGKIVYSIAFLVVMACTLSAYIWGDAADAAYDIVERHRPRWWPIVMEKAEVRRFMRHMAVGMIPFFTVIAVAPVLHLRRWMLAIGVLTFYATMVWLGARFLWRQGAGVWSRIAARVYVVTVVAAMTWITGVLVARIMWGVDLDQLLWR